MENNKIHLRYKKPSLEVARQHSQSVGDERAWVIFDGISSSYSFLSREINSHQEEGSIGGFNCLNSQVVDLDF